MFTLRLVKFGGCVGLLVAVGAFLGGCERSSRWEVTAVAGICVESVDGPDGAVLEISAQMDTCLSSSCDRLVDSECTVTEVDGVLQIDARAVIESKGTTCTTDCGGASVTCVFENPEAQTYVVRAEEDVSVSFDGDSSETVCSPMPL